MGHKKVCCKCRKAFSVQKNIETDINLICPECGGKMTLFDHKFRPPKQSNSKQWELVEFLKNNGFVYQHIYRSIERGMTIVVKYPENMADARSFVQLYRSQAYRNTD